MPAKDKDFHDLLKKVGWVRSLLEKEGLRLQEGQGQLRYGKIDGNRLRLTWGRGLILLDLIFPNAGKIEFYYQAPGEGSLGTWQIGQDVDPQAPTDQVSAHERNLKAVAKKCGLDRIKNPVPDSEVERLVRACARRLRNTSLLNIV